MAPGDTASSRSLDSRLRVSLCDGRGVPIRRPALAAWLSRVAPPRARGSVTVAFVSDARMRTLNRTWRQVDRATDVLSFPATDRAEEKGGRAVASAARVRRRRAPSATIGSPTLEGLPAAVAEDNGGQNRHLGDIVIATGVAARQARDAGHAEATEWRVLALHGLLHLLGYDHERDRGEMARVEARLRRRGGLAAGLIERAPRGRRS
jgi:probable rRNA maturation factor